MKTTMMKMEKMEMTSLLPLIKTSIFPQNLKEIALRLSTAITQSRIFKKYNFSFEAISLPLPFLFFISTEHNTPYVV
jgi:hypothetical protein